VHELSIALSIVDSACEELARREGERVCAVHLKLGPLSGVVREALLFSYDLACADTPLEGTQLVIQDVPIRIYCETCRAERETVSIQLLNCAQCGAPAGRVLQGDELELAALELYEPEVRV
jgi:hydrogenase nickel incorporation protein HypA/HybF